MNHSSTGTYKRTLLLIAAALIAMALLLPLAFRAYLATPHAASQISRMLSSALGEPVGIRQVAVSGNTLHLKGVAISSPDGFPPSKLLSIDSLTVVPRWSTLLSNNRVFEKIAVEGMAVELRRNSAGIWNFDQLLRRFSSSKPSSAEVLVRRLEITKGSLQVDEQRIAGLSLGISDFATKGSEQSGFKLEFDDPGRNHYALSGKARLGREPELELALTSSSVSLKSLPELLKLKNRYLPESGHATLQLSAELRKSMLKASGQIAFNAAAIAAAGRGKSFNGNLTLAAGYDLKNDHLTIETIALQLDRLPAVRLSGSVKELKGAKKFVIEARTGAVDIGAITPLIPELERKKIAVGGTLAESSLRLSGNGVEGITSARGSVGFSHGSLRQGERLFFNDLGLTAVVSARGDSLTANGKAAQVQTPGEPILETIDAPFAIAFNRRSKTVRAESPGLSARARGVSFTGKISYAGGTGLIEHAGIKAGDLTVALGRLSARIPPRQASREVVRYPVNAVFSGVDIRRGDAVLKNLSGNILGAYASDPGGRWLEGAAELSAEKASWQGKEADAVALRAGFSKFGGKAEFKATTLGGSVAGNAAFNPFAPQEKVEFKVGATGITLAEIMRYAGVRGTVAVSGGTLDLLGNGVYSRSGGISGHLEAKGKNVAATGKGGKTILAGAGINVNADLSGGRLVLNEIALHVGRDVTAKAGGTLEDAFLPARRGRIAFSVPETSLAVLVDSFLNVMPRSIQEAKVEGKLAAEGAVSLHQGEMLVDGALTLAHIGIDAPTEKITVTDINGVIPLSLDLAGKSAVKLPPSSGFKRSNYDALVGQFRRTAEKGGTITIGKSSYGGLGMDSAKLQLRASDGITEIVSLSSSLYDGALLGTGYITLQNGILYRGDLLFNGLSLSRICRAFPAITGYISGKIDGILSFHGKGKGLSGISGFTELWARGTDEEKMLVSREFLQRLSGKKLSGFFFSSDRSYDHAGIKAALEKGFLDFDALDISHTNFLGIRDLSVSIAPSQNRIALDHLLNSIKEATVRGKSVTGTTENEAPVAAPPETEFKWEE